MIEKHLTLRRADGVPDGAFSLEREELTEMVANCRTASSALGTVSHQRQRSEGAMTVFQRSIYVVADMAAGETFNIDNLRTIRPGYGLKATYPPKGPGCRAYSMPSHWEAVV